MKKTISISVDTWLYDWFKAQRQGGYNISRLVSKAVINHNHLAPPNMQEIKEKLKLWQQK